LALDEEGASIDRKKHTPAQKKLYKKHHKMRGIMVASIPRIEYMKMSDKSTTKAVRRLERQRLLCLFISMSCSI